MVALERLAVWVAVALLAACAGRGLSEPQVSRTNTPLTLASGATVTAPGGGWRAIPAAKGISLHSPGDLIRIDVVEPEGTFESGDSAIDAAWRVAGFGRPFPVETRTEPPPTRGWDAVVELAYLEPPNEKLVQFAHAHRKGNRWTVLLGLGPQAEVARRASQARIPGETIAAGDYKPESFAGRTPAALDAPRLAKILAFVRDSQKLLDIPGVGLSIWQGGKPVFEGGVGVRDIKSGAKVTADTSFMIASNTKALSTLLLAKQVDAGRIKWTDKVVDAWPAFRLGDEASTQAIEIRHLVCACTGMPRRDFEWVFQPSAYETAQSVMDATAQMVPTSEFGALFQYNNQLGAMSGFAAAQLYYPGMEVGTAYVRAMQEQVFDPLGMTRTTFDYERGKRGGDSGDAAVPYGTELDGQVVQLDDTLNRYNTGFAPTGAAWSTPRDVMRYLQMELRNGLLPDGTRLVGEQALLQRRVPTVPIDASSQYAMSLIVKDVAGITVIEHGGSLVGFLSNMMLVPELDLAIVVLTNSDNGRALINAMDRAVLEAMFDGQPEAIKQVRKSADEIGSFRQSIAESTRSPVPGDLDSSLARSYASDELGTLRLERRKGELWLKTKDWDSPLRSRRNEDGTYSLVVATPWLLGVELVVGEDAGTRTLVFHDAQRSYTFRAATTRTP